MHRIALIVALEEELRPFLKSLEPHCKKANHYFSSGSPCFAYEATLGNDTQVLVAFNGRTQIPNAKNGSEIGLIGTVAAALTTFQVVQNFKPSMVISAGTAGGFESGGSKVGDIFLSGCVRYHDRRIPIAGYKEVAEAPQPICKDAEKIANALQIKLGTICTGDSFALTGSDLDHLKNLEADAIEMEAASVAYVCSLTATPFLALKAITDLVDTKEKPAADQFLENLEFASKKLCQKLSELVQEIGRI